MKIWRDGKETDLTYKLPRAEYSDELVPEQSFDHPPDYVMTGGFVFVRLTDAFLRSWGADWRQRAPFRLGFYETGKVKPDRMERVVLSQVLPDPINLGYEMLHDEVVDEVNGMKISKISDLLDALEVARQRLRRLQVRARRNDGNGRARRLRDRRRQPGNHDPVPHPGGPRPQRAGGNRGDAVDQSPRPA